MEQTNRTLTSEIASNLEAQKASIDEFNSKISTLEISEKSLQDQVLYLTQQNEETKSNLRLKDETKEQEYLNMKHIENEMREEADALKKEIVIRDAAMARNDSELQKLIEAKDTIIAEHKEAAVGSEHLHMIIVKQKDEEVAQVNTSLQELRKINESLSNDKLNLNQEIETKTSLMDELQKKIDEISRLSIKFENDSDVNLKVIEDNKQLIDQHENRIKTFESKVGELSTINIELEGKVTELLAINANMSDALENDKTLESELRKQIQTSIEEVVETKKSKSELEELLVNRDKCIEEQQKLTIDLQNKFGEIAANNEALQKELNDYRFNAENKDEAFVKLNATLNDVKNRLNEKCEQLEDSQRSLSLTSEQSKVASQHNSALTNEIEQLKISLDSNLSSVADLGAKIILLEDVHKSDMETVNTLNKEIQAMYSQIDVLTKENLALNETSEKTQSALESAKLENETQLDVTKELKQEIDSIRKIIATKNDEIDKIQKTNSDIQGKLEKSVQNGNDVQDKHSKLEVEYGDLNRKMVLLEEKCEQVIYFSTQKISKYYLCRIAETHAANSR